MADDQISVILEEYDEDGDQIIEDIAQYGQINVPDQSIQGIDEGYSFDDNLVRPMTPNDRPELNASVTPQTRANSENVVHQASNNPTGAKTFHLRPASSGSDAQGFVFGKAPVPTDLYGRKKDTGSGDGNRRNSVILNERDAALLRIPARETPSQIASAGATETTTANPPQIEPAGSRVNQQRAPTAVHSKQNKARVAKVQHVQSRGTKHQDGESNQQGTSHRRQDHEDERLSKMITEDSPTTSSAIQDAVGSPAPSRTGVQKIKVSKMELRTIPKITPQRRSKENASRLPHTNVAVATPNIIQQPFSIPPTPQPTSPAKPPNMHEQEDAGDILDIFGSSNSPHNPPIEFDHTAESREGKENLEAISGDHNYAEMHRDGPSITSNEEILDSDLATGQHCVEMIDDEDQQAPHDACESGPTLPGSESGPSNPSCEIPGTPQEPEAIPADLVFQDRLSLDRVTSTARESPDEILESITPGPRQEHRNLIRQTPRPQHHVPQTLSPTKQPAILHRPSDREGPVKVTKSRSKSRLKPVSVPSQTPATATPSVGDVFRILQWTMEQEQQRSAVETEDRYRAYHSDIANLKASEANKEAQLEAARKENSALIEQLRDAKAKLGNYGERLSQLTKFVNGLGSDLDKVREHGRSFGKHCEDLVLESKTRHEERKQLQEYFQTCVTTSSKIKDLVSKACRAAQVERQDIERRSEEVQKSIEAKTNLLQGEKARTAELQDQLKKAVEVQGTLKDLLEEKFGGMSQKLASMHQDIATIMGAGTAEPELGVLGDQVKELCSKPICSPADFEKVENAVQQLSDKMSSHFQTFTIAGTDRASTEKAIETQLKEQLVEIKIDMLNCQTLQNEIVEVRASKVAFEERCAAKDASISGLEGQLAALHEKEAAFSEKLSQAELEISQLKLAAETHQRTATRLHELELQNSYINQQLSSAKEGLHVEVEKASSLQESEALLKTRVEELEQQLASSSKDSADIEAIKAEATRLAEQRINERCSEITRDANKFHSEKTAEFDNKLHQEKQKSLKTEDLLKRIQNELSEAKAKLDANHQASVAAQTTRTEMNVLQDRIKSLQKGLDEKENELCESKEENKKVSEEQARQKRAEIAEMENQLKAEAAARKTAESNYDRLQKHIDNHVKEQEEKSTRQIEGLHQQIAETEREKNEIHNKLQKAMKDAEHAIKAASDKHKAEVGDLQRRLQESEGSRNQAEQDLRRLKDSVRGQLKEGPTSQAITETIKASESQNVDSQLRHPRKKVNRQNQSIIEVPRSSYGIQQLSSRTNAPRDEFSQGQYQDVFDTFIDAGDETIGQSQFASNPIPFSQFNNSKPLPATQEGASSSSPLSDARSISDPDASKENQRTHTPAALRGRSEKRVLRELTVNATTPDRPEGTPVPMPPQRESSSLGRTQPLANPFDMYDSPGAGLEGLEVPSLFRPQSNSASQIIHEHSRPTIYEDKMPHPQSQHGLGERGAHDMNTSLLQRHEPMRRSLITMPADARKVPATNNSSTPDYMQDSPLLSQKKATTYGHHSSSRPNSGPSRRGSTVARATPATEQHVEQTLRHSASKERKRRATAETVPAQFSPPAKRLRTREERDYAELSSQGSQAGSQYAASTQTPSRSVSMKASQTQQPKFKTSQSQSQQKQLHDVPLSTRARIGSSNGPKQSAGRGGSNRGKKGTGNERYSARFSQK
ncbi:hypothetical protein NA57DRAFT_77120 [Rhizodiscina lignyota]|uniref:Uncharacterized protein n=1 Tax=Rhizodiscina lignyota TaxID=1504668 RepID=A0A9P4IAL7_9PEZI|nr:hypothetical protein NA57DRAFT_77120 [Rhizodiscina lignyota]